MKDRLRAVLRELVHKELVKNQTDFGSKLGYGKSYFSQVMNGHEPLTRVIAGEIETKFSVNHEWLLTGQGNMFINDNTHYKKKEEPMNEKILQMLEKELERNDQRWNTLLTAHNKLIDSLAEKRELVKH